MGACCSKCCSKRSGVCRCAFRCPHLCSCSSCCVPKVLPETNLITPEDRWSNLPSSKQQILDEIGLVRIAPKDNTHPASDLRTTPFVAHLKVTIPTLGNAWLSDHPHVYKFAMQTSYGPTAPDRQIHDFSDESLDPFQEEFHFVIDRSRSVLHIALREPSFGPQAQKRCWGQGHKAHQWEMMIDGSGAPAGEDPADGDAGERSHGGASLVSFDETPSLDSIDSVCPEICEMGAADVSYGTTIREGANLVTLKPRPDSETGDIVIKIEYTPMRGTMDSGRCYGPGYVGLREGGGCCGRGAKNRLRFGLSENWLCAHDNVYVTNEARDCENNLTMLRLVEKLGISVDRDQMADSMYRQMSVGHGAAVEAKAQHNEQAINSSLQLLEVESESDTERELRASAGALFHHMNNRLLALESREANWRCDVHGEWFSSGSSLGAMAYMIVPLDQWHALRPEQDEETPSTKDPFWQNWDDAITLAGDRKNAGSFSIPLPYHHLSMPGIVTVRAFRDDGQFAAGNVFLLDKGTKLVVFDCDGTLTTGDHEVVTQFIVSTTYDPQRVPASVSERSARHHVQLDHELAGTSQFPPRPDPPHPVIDPDPAHVRVRWQVQGGVPSEAPGERPGGVRCIWQH
eukprot:TRINITY_DN2574_c0_g1_i2.p1 TRINITY_DN2574_c0_g1~~TRINITY_DN2574_c0_g1_i2.p1  ORF type:complete len:628 (+),score=90.39 TRINITY_DN2574_c0_g1_i2:41-1924(+)